MTKEEFWRTIETVNRQVPDGDHEMGCQKMYEELVRHSPREILDWYLISQEYLKAACRNDLRAAATALGAQVSDDGFIDFRTWLISQGKDIYMEAMRDPDCLAQNPHSGVDMNFEGFIFSAVQAYGEKLNHSGKDEIIRLYEDLDNYKLSDQIVTEIQEEIPKHPDAPSNRLPLDYSEQFPRIWERMTSRSPELCAMEKALDYFISIPGVVYAYVYQNEQCDEYRFADTPKNIANFIGGHSAADRIVLTDVLDRLLLDTCGNIINTCPDKELLNKVKHFLIPIQTGEVQPEPVRCECLTEQEDQQGAPGEDELVTVHRMPDGTYQLYKTEVPDEWFEGVSANLLVCLEYCDLATVQERLPSLLAPADDDRLCVLTKCDEDRYGIGVIVGAAHITDYIKQQANMLCSGDLSELVQQLSDMPCSSPSHQNDYEIKFPL